MQIPLPIIVTIVAVILIVIWRNSEGKRKTENVLGRKAKEKVTPEIPVSQEAWKTPPSSPTPPPTKKKGVEFKFGTLIGWAAFVAVIYLFTSCASNVVREMAKPQPQVVKDMRRWTVIAPTNGWSEIIHTPPWFHTECLTPAKLIKVLLIKSNGVTEEISASGLGNPDTIGQGMRFKSLTNKPEEVNISQWSLR